ncbi:hypothetical protein ACWD6P_19370 [Streptomyces sp. NPDC002446]
MPLFRPAAARGSTRGRIRHRMRVLCAELRRGLVRMLALALGTALLAGAMGALLPPAQAHAADRTAPDRTPPGRTLSATGSTAPTGALLVSAAALLAAGSAVAYATRRRASR